MLYKPSYDEALSIVLSRLANPLPIHDTATAMTQNRISAATIKASHAFPPSDLSMRDGYALEHDGNGARIEPIRTGEPVPKWAKRIIPEELYDPSSVPPIRGEQTDHRPYRVHAGDEYKEGDVVVARGDRIDHHHVTQLSLLGQESVCVYRAPTISVTVLGEETSRFAITTWLQGFVGSYYQVNIVSEPAKTVKQGLASCHDSEADLAILVSDGAPGRYSQLRELFKSETSDFEALFWKMRLNPCKHVGFGTTVGTPVLVLPDVFFKTVTTAFALLPPILAQFVNNELQTQQACWETLPDIHYEYPCLVPVRVAKEKEGLHVSATPLRSTFSARWVSKAEGYTILQKPPRIGDRFKTNIVGMLKS